MCKAHFISCFANSCNLIKIFKTIFEYIRKKFRFVHTNTFCEYRKKLRASPRVHLVIITVKSLAFDMQIVNAQCSILFSRPK